MKKPLNMRALYLRAFTEDPALSLKGAYMRVLEIAKAEGIYIGGPQPAVAVAVRKSLGIVPAKRGRPAVATVPSSAVPEPVRAATPASARPVEPTGEDRLKDAIRALRACMGELRIVEVTVTATTATCRRMVDVAVDA